MQFQFDARQIAPSQAPEVWPSDWYPLVITGHDFRPTQDGGGKLLVLNVQATAGQRAGQNNFIRLNMENSKSPIAVQIAYETLSAICWVIGKPAINDITELHGIPFWAFTPPEKDAQSNNWRNFRNQQGVEAIQLAKQGGGTVQRAQQQQSGGQQPQGGGSWGGQQQQQPPQGMQGGQGGQGGWAPPGGAPAQQPQGQQPGGWAPPGGGGPPQGQQPPQGGGGWAPPGGGQQTQQPQGQQPPQQGQQPQGGWTPGGQTQGGSPPWGR